jgi:hypothetical protein
MFIITSSSLLGAFSSIGDKVTDQVTHYLDGPDSPSVDGLQMVITINKLSVDKHLLAMV